MPGRFTTGRMRTALWYRALGHATTTSDLRTIRAAHADSPHDAWFVAAIDALPADRFAVILLHAGGTLLLSARLDPPAPEVRPHG
jgi:hypothetical protein